MSNQVEPANNNSRIRKACGEFEGYFLGMILKKTMKSGVWEDKENLSSPNATFTEYAAEQAGRMLGNSSACKIAESLYQSITEANNQPEANNREQ